MKDLSDNINRLAVWWWWWLMHWEPTLSSTCKRGREGRKSAGWQRFWRGGMDELGWRERVHQLSPYQGSTHPSDPVTYLLLNYRIKALTTGRISSFADVVRNTKALKERDGWNSKLERILLDFVKNQVFLWQSTFIAGEKHSKWKTGRWLHYQKMGIKQQVDLNIWS